MKERSCLTEREGPPDTVGRYAVATESYDGHQTITLVEVVPIAGGVLLWRFAGSAGLNSMSSQPEGSRNWERWDMLTQMEAPCRSSSS